jgi:hypothetical protein
MYVDADEHCEDCTPLIDFFVSGRYKNYDSASVMIKNIISPENDNLIRAVHLVRLDGGIHFEGRVHEHLVAPMECTYETGAVFSHKGYFGELMGIKSARNLPLSEMELQTAKSVHRKAIMHLQIAEEAVKADPRRALREWKEGLKLSLKIPSLLKYAFLIRLEVFRFEQHEFAKVKKLHRQYMHLRKCDSTEDLYMDLEDAFYAGLSLAALGDYNESR